MCSKNAAVVNFVEKLVVVPDEETPHRGTLQCGDRMFSCVLGRSGVRKNKQEGDGATPAGSFKLRKVLYRADRTMQPQTALLTTPIGENDGWCDEPGDPLYNRAVEIPHRANVESLWREDNRYDVVVVIGYNDDPVDPGAGSAIFMHLIQRSAGPTAGCIALDLLDMSEILKFVTPDSFVEINTRLSTT